MSSYLISHCDALSFISDISSETIVIPKQPGNDVHNISQGLHVVVSGIWTGVFDSPRRIGMFTVAYLCTISRECDVLSADFSTIVA